MEETLNQPSRNSRGPKPDSGWNRKLKKLMSLLLTLFIIGIIALCILYLYLRTQALPVAYIPQTSQIFDMNGELIDSFHVGQNRQVVDLDQISPHAVNAALAIEDRRFYRHFGFDLRGLARAVYVNIEQMGKVQGASSITQQLARNLYLTHERTWNRKLKEAMYTVQLEMKYSKDEILAQYLNQIYYGHATYGIQAAAQVYFDKDAKDLTLAESALLAGVPKGPRYYSPYMNMENAKNRQYLVLQAMVSLDMITQREADAAYAEEFELMPLEGDQASEAPYFRDVVRQQAMQLLQMDEDEFNQGGYLIHTTLDLRAQRIAEETIQQHMGSDTELQVALVSIDPRNGYVKAMVGGKDYAENQYNRVFATTRQPGSSFKPFVYLTALKDPNFSAVTRFKSEPTVFTYDEGRESYMPNNFGNRYAHDFIDLREAVRKSDNIYAVNTIMQVTPEAVIEMARKLGVQGHMNPVPSLALGTYPVSPYELARAYATFANQGVYVEPRFITHITDGSGKVLYESELQQEQVINPAHAYVLTSLLESVFDPGGTANRAASTIKRPVAGKTGTTNTDAWMVGYTPELSTAVWVGYDRDRNISSVESMLPTPIFAEFTERTLEPIPPKLFTVPEEVVSLYINPESGKLATPDCPETRLEHFVIGSEPKEFCTDHRMMLEMDLEELQPVEEIEEHSSWWEDVRRWWTQ